MVDHTWVVNYLRRTPLDKVVGYIWGELKDGCIYAFTGAKLSKILGEYTETKWVSDEKWTQPSRSSLLYGDGGDGGNGDDDIDLWQLMQRPEA